MRPICWSATPEIAMRLSPTTDNGSKPGPKNGKLPESGGSPSVQVKEADIQAGHNNGVHHLTKTSPNFGQANIVTMSPAMFPAYLLNNDAVLRGSMSATQAQGRNCATKRHVRLLTIAETRDFRLNRT